MTDNRAFLVEYLKVLTERTTKAEIKWRSANPTTYEWAQSINGEEHIVSLQKYSSPDFASLLSGSVSDNFKYIFQVVEKESQQVKISIRSSDKFNLHEELKQLYIAIEDAIDSASVEILRNLLGL